LEETMTNLAKFAFNASDPFDEAAMREAFSHAVPLRTVVVYCFDPRAARIPERVAEHLGDTYPGKIVLDDKGNKIASTATVFPIVVAGGRAVDALRSIAIAQHLFGIENIVVVHHFFAAGRPSPPKELSMHSSASSIPTSVTPSRSTLCASPITSSR
jgi:carbonic anhydrase